MKAELTITFQAFYLINLFSLPYYCCFEVQLSGIAISTVILGIC